MKLLNPGPVTLTEGVRKSLLLEDMCHREPEFAEMSLDILTRIANVYPESKADFIPVLLTGSGTSAVEAMVGSLIPEGAKTLVVANGVYGDRAAQMLKAQKKAHEVVAADWKAPMDLGATEKALATGAYTYVIAVHHETTTGRLNDIDALGKLCVKYKARLLLDGVSSFGGEAIRFAEWNLEAVAGTANKCLHGVPGIAFVVARKDAFTSRTTGATSVYLDLYRYRKEQEKGFSPFTQSVHVLYALREALRELEAEGGLEARHKLFRDRSNAIVKGLADLGIQTFLGDPGVYGATLVSFTLPAGLDYEHLHHTMKEGGYVIYAGQGPFMGQIFRIANMGALDAADLERIVSLVKASLAKKA